MHFPTRKPKFDNRPAVLRTFKAAAQHYLNPLHVYCRLRDCGIPKRRALGVSGFYERHIYSRFTA